MQFIFKITEVLPLLAHSQGAKKHHSLYGMSGTDVPGLWLVKDQGVYLMSNADPGLREGEGSHHKVVYAEGWGPESYLGGDDFGELIAAEDITKIFGRAAMEGRKTFRVLVAETEIELKL